MKEPKKPVRETRICPVCGKEFVERYKFQKYCSDECAKKVQHRIPQFRIFTEKPSQKKIDAINAEARRQGKTYGKLQAEKLLEKQHLEMEARANGALM